MIIMATCLKFDEILGGHSGARVFKFQMDHINYCLKIPKRQITEADIIKFQKICEIYQQTGIKSLEYLGYGYYGATPKAFYLYRYVPGYNLDALSEQIYTLSETHQAGVDAGRTIRKLKNYATSDIATYIPTDNIDNLTEDGNRLYAQLLNTPQLYNALCRFCNLNQVQLLIDTFNHATGTFRALTPQLIHGDIKCSNIIVDSVGKQCFIDIAAMKISYDVLNFHYQMTWNLLPENHKRRAFTKGFFDGLYDGSRPENFHQQIIYVTILNFLKHSVKFADDPQEIEWYFQKMQPVFAELLANTKII